MKNFFYFFIFYTLISASAYCAESDGGSGGVTGGADFRINPWDLLPNSISNFSGGMKIITFEGYNAVSEPDPKAWYADFEFIWRKPISVSESKLQVRITAYDGKKRPLPAPISRNESLGVSVEKSYEKNGDSAFIFTSQNWSFPKEAQSFLYKNTAFKPFFSHTGSNCTVDGAKQSHEFLAATLTRAMNAAISQMDFDHPETITTLNEIRSVIFGLYSICFNEKEDTTLSELKARVMKNRPEDIFNSLLANERGVMKNTLQQAVDWRGKCYPNKIDEFLRLVHTRKFGTLEYRKKMRTAGLEINPYSKDYTADDEIAELLIDRVLPACSGSLNNDFTRKIQLVIENRDLRKN